MSNGCLCQQCGRYYKHDFIVPDILWEKIRPVWKEGIAGLLCGHCIVTKVEALSEFNAWTLYETHEERR